MCRGRPKQHPCGHQSMDWSFCFSSHHDLQTNRTTPCRNQDIRPIQDVTDVCPEPSCVFHQLGGAWVCCQCKYKVNFKAWCAACRPPEMRGYGHYCCLNCYPAGEIWYPNVREKKARKPREKKDKGGGSSSTRR